jgi:hypothetical protein
VLRVERREEDVVDCEGPNRVSGDDHPVAKARQCLGLTLVLSPQSIRRCEIVDLGEVGELLGGSLGRGDTELMFEFARSGSTNTWSGAGGSVRTTSWGQLDIRRRAFLRTYLTLHLGLALDAQRMTAARVGPHAGEGDLLNRTSLEQELAGLRMEEEDGKSAVEEVSRREDVGHEVA